MSLLLHISDPHFGTEQPQVIAGLMHLVLEQSPDIAVVSGDITQRARPNQFRAARLFFESLAVHPTLVLPGNHDIPLFNIFRRLFTPYRQFQRQFGSELEPSFEAEDVQVIGVNTTRPYRHVNGEVSMRQIDDVAQKLRRGAPKQLRVVVTHQPVHVDRSQERHNVLRGHKEAVCAWADAGADLILGGHAHLPDTYALRDEFEELPRAVWAVQAGTSISCRVRREAPNSVNLIRYSATQTPRRCTVEQWNFDASERRFRLAKCKILALDN